MDFLSTTPHLLLLPGLDGTGDLFAPLQRFLPPGIKVSIARYPTDRIQDADTLLEQIHQAIPPGVPHLVLAESFSGPLAIRYAAQRSADVRGLILAASFLRNPLPWFVRWLPWLANRWCFGRLSGKFAAQGFLLNASASASEIAAVQAAMHKVDPQVLAARVKALPQIDATEDFQSLEMPMLYLLAKQDRIVGRRGIGQIKMLKPEMPIQSLDSPHLILQAQPEACIEAIQNMSSGKLG